MKKPTSTMADQGRQRQRAPLAAPTDLASAATIDITGALNAILADVFAMYLKTKNFHWHMSGPHFRDYHLLLDEQADQIYAMADPIAERVRKLGGSTLRSIGHIARTQRVLDNDADYVEPLDMLGELRDDNEALATRLLEAHGLCDEHRDIASASLIEVWIDETERAHVVPVRGESPRRLERSLMLSAVRPSPLSRSCGRRCWFRAAACRAPAWAFFPFASAHWARLPLLAQQQIAGGPEQRPTAVTGREPSPRWDRRRPSASHPSSRRSCLLHR
jgi:starvation-inducible DNA-binding protein